MEDSMSLRLLSKEIKRDNYRGISLQTNPKEPTGLSKEPTSSLEVSVVSLSVSESQETSRKGLKRKNTQSKGKKRKKFWHIKF